MLLAAVIDEAVVRHATKSGIPIPIWGYGDTVLYTGTFKTFERLSSADRIGRFVPNLKCREFNPPLFELTHYDGHAV
jgi:hypothetical protein